MPDEDKRLLELAAKAAGIAIVPCSCSNPRWPFKHDEAKSGEHGHWNPLVNDGDALRLAVKLRLVIHVWSDGEAVSTAKTLPDGQDPPDHSREWHSADAHACGGVESATRRAIVSAAAAIGEKMP